MTRQHKLVGLLVGLLVLWGVIVLRGGDEPEPERVVVTAQASTRGTKTLPRIDLAPLEQKGAPSTPPGRDLFNYYEPPPTRTPYVPPPTPTPTPTVVATPTPPPVELPPPPPNINLELEGLMEVSEVKWAVLRDDQGLIHLGREGDTIAYRFKVLKIGHESVDMGYVDRPDHKQLNLKSAGS